jgi:glycosyltransferase involved in cell wall biosynthesis
MQRIAFVSYETPLAPAGGVAPVMGRLPCEVARASGLPTVILTPYHHRIERTASACVVDSGSIRLRYADSPLVVNLLRVEGEVPIYLLRPESEEFFGGTPHPYAMRGTQATMARTLVRDSLLFGACVVEALHAIDSTATWSVLMQDWEAATTALAAAGRPHRHRLYLTLHNSYDSAATNADLAVANMNGLACPGSTVLDRALPLVRDPIFTVSDQFAIDLLEDTIQTSVLANHLSAPLGSRVIGVNNGPFVPLYVDEDALTRAARGDPEGLMQWKRAARHRAIDALHTVAATPAGPLWGDADAFQAASRPCWFVMAGRDDPRQKGYDVAVAAAEQFLDSGGDAQFLFFPIPGDENLSGLSFLERLARRHPSKVIAFPFRWDDGFKAVVSAASFGLLPSFYEPFGMVNELYLRGTAAIGRSTGGITQQIVPCSGVASYSRAAQVRASRWHSFSAAPTGLLFRERDGMPSQHADWHGINAASYRVDGAPDRIAERRGEPGDRAGSGYALYRAMIRELQCALADGASIVEGQPAFYYRMLRDGIDFIGRTFSWRRAAYEYTRHVV